MALDKFMASPFKVMAACKSLCPTSSGIIADQAGSVKAEPNPSARVRPNKSGAVVMPDTVSAPRIAAAKSIQPYVINWVTDVTHGVAKLALPVKSSLDTPKQIAVGWKPIADNSAVVCAQHQLNNKYFTTTVVTCEWHQLALVSSHDKAIDLSTVFVENYVIRLANLSEIAACARCTKNDHSVRHGGNKIGSLECLKRLKSEF